MRSHLATQRLSAYLDEELPDRELRQVEAHVSECPACQTRLHGLRLVVSELQRVPAVEAPPSLARSIEAEAAMRWGPPAWRERRQLGRRGLDLLRDLIQLSVVTAGVVAIIATLMAWTVSRHRAATATGDAPAAPVESPAASLLELGSPDRAEVNGRTFVFRDGTWWQEDLLPEVPIGPPPPTLDAPAAMARAPWLASLVRFGGVVFELDGAMHVADLVPPALPRGRPSAPCSSPEVE